MDFQKVECARFYNPNDPKAADDDVLLSVVNPPGQNAHNDSIAVSLTCACIAFKKAKAAVPQ